MSSSKCGYLLPYVIRYASRPKFGGTSSIRNVKSATINSNASKDIHTSSRLLCLADGGGGSHKPTPFQRKVFVWTKAYSSEGEVPDRVTRSQMKNAMDKFRVRVSIGMVAMTFIFAAIMALFGRKARNEGQTITKLSRARRQD